MDSLDIAGLRREYETNGLRRADLHPDPIEQFSIWFSTAVSFGVAGRECDQSGHGHARRPAFRARLFS